MSDLILRTALGLLGAVFIHDAVWWSKSWFFGKPMGGWWKRQSEFAQTLYRMSLVFFGSLTLLAAVFGAIVRP